VRRWSAAVVFFSLALVPLVLSGCLFAGAGEVESLELTASQEVLAFGETVQLNAVGRTTTGKTVAVIPDWELVQGTGTLGESSFRASSWGYEGPVVLRASYQGVSAELTLSINGLLGEPNPFPRPSGPNAALPKATDPDLYQIGEPLSEYAEYIFYWVTYPFGDLQAAKELLSYFVRDGNIQKPELMASEKNRYARVAIMDRIYEEELLPEIPRLSHRVHYELIDSEVLGGGTSFSRTISYRQGTTLEQVTELHARLVPDMANSHGLGWSNLSRHLARQILKYTQEAVEVEPEQTAVSTWSFASPDDALHYLHTAWVRVDTFYLSDSGGTPLERSGLFSDYGFSSCPVEIRGEVVYVTWSW
jgi:hypothetical protein